jgi:hypothetical protein
MLIHLALTHSATYAFTRAFTLQQCSAIGPGAEPSGQADHWHWSSRAGQSTLGLVAGHTLDFWGSSPSGHVCVSVGTQRLPSHVVHPESARQFQCQLGHYTRTGLGLPTAENTHSEPPINTRHASARVRLRVASHTFILATVSLGRAPLPHLHRATWTAKPAAHDVAPLRKRRDNEKLVHASAQPSTVPIPFGQPPKQSTRAPTHGSRRASAGCALDLSRAFAGLMQRDRR